MAAEAAQEKKSKNTCILDLRGLSSITDYFVICSVTSDVQGRAVADNVQEELSKSGADVWFVEGYEHAKWILLDYVDVVVHIFEEETRDFYGLDRLWGDAPRAKLSTAAKKGKKK
ncbi:ribosome silencing factor [candidate division TA06 bacterium]|uniref:Ribosomal silencing factor RsfS n=1 Tax=candidate division TA06 bacterium TaxID=2250710 RepID=A0A523XFC3_UNCT6|nr:MAG: ribosome silencing factor [candidate division TA06 bacterium]